jgi:uncharacterized protein (DUF983 family)
MRVTYGNSSSGGNGIGFAGMLTVAFIVLKLANVIDWSWWWVTAPLWIPVVLFIATCVIMFIVGIFIGIARTICKANKRRD